MTGATLFSGIGAPEVAMPHWAWPWHAEIDKFPSAVMAARHPHSLNLGDVTRHDFTTRALAAGRPDVLVFGSPCQSFSVAGSRLGLDDPRGNLALVALGAVARLEPAWFVFENVPGLLSSADGRDFGLFLRTVDELGYHVAWTVLDAQYRGLAQRRERVFVVGHARDWRYPAAVLFEPAGLSGHSAPRREARENPTGTLAARTRGGGGLSTDFECQGGLIPERERALSTSNQRIDYETETLITAFDARQSDVIEYGDMSGPLDTDGHTVGVGVGVGVRRLTPRECERLQGLPDDYTRIDYRGAPAKDGPRYKAIGNSMAVPVVQWILERIEFLDGLDRCAMPVDCGKVNANA